MAETFDVVVVGAGFSGLYILRELLKRGYKAHLFDDGEGPGGTWDKNWYPGARVDSEIWVYQFTDPELWENFYFSEKFPGWRELVSYFKFVVSKWGLETHITYRKRVEFAKFDESSCRWMVRLNDGQSLATNYLILATGSTTKPIMPSYPGMKDFKGRFYHSARWPREDVDFSGKRVGVVGTGASGVQIIQEVALKADHLTVFQRTPNLALPMRQEKYTPEEYRKLRQLFAPAMEKSRQTFAGFAYDLNYKPWKEMTAEEKIKLMTTNWERGGFSFWLAAPFDLFFDEECNRDHYNFWRDQTRKRIKKEHLIEKLAPTEPPHPFGVKRPCLEQWYFEVYNQDNVELVDVNERPIERFTENGVVAGGKEIKLDLMIFATGFDNNTGAIAQIKIYNQHGYTIGEVWEKDYITYLGKAVPGFPNLLFTYALQSPSAFLNGPTAAELEGDWVVRVLDDMRARGVRRFEPKWDAADAWHKHCVELSQKSLFPRAKSWYMGANVPGKRVELLPYMGGQVAYRKALYDETEKGYPNFILDKREELAQEAQMKTDTQEVLQ